MSVSRYRLEAPPSSERSLVLSTLASRDAVCDASNRELGTTYAPRAFSLKLRSLTDKSGLAPTSYDAELELGRDILTAKHVDDINMAGSVDPLQQYVAKVEQTFGASKRSYDTFTNCGARYSKTAHKVAMDPVEYIATFRPIQHPELTGRWPKQLPAR